MNKQQFLDEIIFGWMKNDLERMAKEIPTNSGMVGNINFPLALCVLTYIESLGSYLLGKDKQEYKTTVGHYISQCFSRPGEYNAELLGVFFRHGLAHQYFSRGAISRVGKRPAVVKDDKYGLILDIDTLMSDFLESLDAFRNKLTDENYLSRMTEISKELETAKNKYMSEISTHKDLSKLRSYHPMYSGASGVAGPIDLGK